MDLFQYKHTKKILFILLIFFSFVSVSWVIKPNNYFVMDDYSTLFRAITAKFELSFLPMARYNDRPFGLLFVKIIYNFCGYNNVVFHIAFLLVHIFNVFMVYKSIRLLFCGEKSFFYALIAAGIFGIYPKSLMAVSWVAAVYDLLCCSFVILSLYCFFYYIKKDKYKTFYGLFSLFFYMCSLRSKEMSLFLPIFFIAVDLVHSISNKNKIRPHMFTYISIAWMLIYFVKLLSFPGLQGNEYEQSFNPIIMFKNFMKYIGLYTDLSNGSMSFLKFNPFMIAGIIAIFLLFLFSLYRIIRTKNWSMIPWIIGTGIIFAPVLTMNQMQHKLYLYIPGIFLGVCLAYAFSEIITIIKKNHIAEFSALILLCLVLCNYTPAVINYNNWWLSFTAKDYNEIKQVEKLPDLSSNTVVYIKGASEGYNIINPYGPGHILNLIYEDMTIKTVLVDNFPENPSKPYTFWEYTDGVFYQVELD